MNEQRLPFELALKLTLDKHETENVYERIRAEAEILMSKSPSLKYSDAIEKIASLHPEWYTAYAKENMNRCEG